MAGDDDQYEDMAISNSDATGIGSDEEPMLESVLSGARADLPEDLRHVEAVLAAAAGPAGPDEFDGLLAAMGEHARVLGPAPAARRRKRVVAVSIGAVAAVLLGTAGAAHANVLPAPIQDFAHRAFGAPSSDERTDPPGTGVRPGGATPGASVPAGHGSTSGVPAGVDPRGGANAPQPGASTDPSPGASAGHGKANAPGQVKASDKATPPGQVTRTEKATPPGQVTRTEKATPPGQVKRTEKATPPGQAKPPGAAAPAATAPSNGNGPGRRNLVANLGVGGRVAR